MAAQRQHLPPPTPHPAEQSKPRQVQCSGVGVLVQIQAGYAGSAQLLSASGAAALPILGFHVIPGILMWPSKLNETPANASLCSP